MAMLINPRTGMPFDTNPDEVDPNDLQTSSQLPGTLLNGPSEPLQRYGAAGAPQDVPLGLSFMEPAKDAPPDQPVPVPAPQAPAGLPPAEAPLAPAPLAPGKPRSGGGGGGAPGSVPGAETTGEAAARDKEEKAQAGQLSAADKETELNERKAAGAEDAARSEQQHIGEMDRIREEKYAKANDHLQSAEDKVANFKVKAIFDGHPGAEVAAALMEGLGAFSAGLTGGENHAAKVLARNAAGFRQRQLDELEQLNKGVGNAKDRMEFVRIELAAKEAGMYKRLAADRASNIARFGGDQAAVDGDKIHNELLAQIATSQRTWQTALHNRGQAEKVQNSQIAENYAGAARNRAEANKANAEAAAGPKDGSGGRAAGIQIQKATLSEHLGEALSNVDRLHAKGVELSDKDKVTIQKNIQDLKAREHAGVWGALAPDALLARGIYSGLSPAKQELANNYEIISQKFAGLTSPSHSEEEMKHGREMMNFLTPGQGKDALEGKLRMSRSVLGAAGALGGKYTGIAQEGAASAHADAPARAKASRDEMAAVMAARAKAKPGTPEWMKWDGTAKAMRAEMGQ